MKTKTPKLTPALAKLTLSAAALCCVSCVAPVETNVLSYPLDPGVAQRNREFTHAIEDDGQQFRHRERMSQAAAVELATRNTPRVIHHTHVVVPRCWW